MERLECFLKREGAAGIHPERGMLKFLIKTERVSRNPSLRGTMILA
jgi:hypothetical protein